MITAAIVAGLLAALLIADRAALICAEDTVARRIRDRGLAGKPRVSIAGFPFLTQLAARRLTKVVVSAAGWKLGPVEVERLDLTLCRIRVSSRYHVGTAAEIGGTALVGFAGLAGAAGLPGVTLGSLRDITLPLPALPPGMMVHDVTVTGQGLLVHLVGQNVRFGG